MLKHHRRRHPQFRRVRINQAAVRLVVVDRRDPLADDHFEFVEGEERVRLGIQPPEMDVRALVARQRLQQIFPRGAKNAPPAPCPGPSAT